MISGRFIVLLVAASATSPAGAQSLSGALRARIDSVVEAELARTGTPGASVAVARKGELLVARGYGVANLEWNAPASAETVYRIASITKQFTAAAVMQLVDAGKISLTDPITRFLPDYPTQGHRVTIEHLLNHTSGIRSYTSVGAKFWVDAVRRDLTNEQMMALFVTEPFDFAPGAEFRYNNGGYFLLGVIIEKVSGLPFPRYLAERIFQPLGMTSTSYCDDRRVVPRRATGYEVVDGRATVALPISTTVLGGAGSICSTVLDLVTWQRAFDRGEVVSAASRDRIRTSARLANGEATNYGFGLNIGTFEGHRLLGHGGGVFGFITWLGTWPDDSVTVTVLTNQGRGPANQIGKLIGRIVLGMSLPPVVDLPVPAEVRARVVGSWGKPEDGVVVTESGGSLWVRMGGPTLRLLYQGGDTFRMRDDLDVVLRLEHSGGVPTMVVVGESGAPKRVTRR